MNKKRQAIVLPEFVFEAMIAVESGNAEDYDLKNLIQRFCSEAKTDQGAPLYLQRFAGLLFEKIFSGALTATNAFGLESHAGRKPLGIDRNKAVCVFIAGEIANGINLTGAKKKAEKEFNLGGSSINTIWQDGKDMGFAYLMFDRRERNHPVSKDERLLMAKYASGRVKGYLTQ